ncbi:hypothetical protein [Sporisorium scitamineum]|uniref:Uncharacterized protein n=1 Tax=Sporisorium scitamineum TaxID=49012 RepID=A0A0F7RZ62_9BASI|nr:hypothetical protein [Sporisorium scitamineum]
MRYEPLDGIRRRCSFSQLSEASLNSLDADCPMANLHLDREDGACQARPLLEPSAHSFLMAPFGLAKALRSEAAYLASRNLPLAAAWFGLSPDGAEAECELPSSKYARRGF